LELAGLADGLETHDRYETERKGSELKTSLSRKRLSRSHDIGEAVTVGPESSFGVEGPEAYAASSGLDIKRSGGQRQTP